MEISADKGIQGILIISARLVADLSFSPRDSEQAVTKVREWVKCVKPCSAIKMCKVTPFRTYIVNTALIIISVCC